jgi:hypothetical protein
LAAKLAEVAPAGNASETGTLNFELLLVRLTVMPAVGAGAVRVVVQVLLLPETMNAGVHCNPASEMTRGVTVNDTVCDVARLAVFSGTAGDGGT